MIKVGTEKRNFLYLCVLPILPVLSVAVEDRKVLTYGWQVV